MAFSISDWCAKVGQPVQQPYTDMGYISTTFFGGAQPVSFQNLSDYVPGGGGGE